MLAASGPHSDLGLGDALGSALRKVMAALPEPHRPVATVTSQRIAIDPAGWMRARDPVGHLDVLQSAVFADRRLRLDYRHSGRSEARSYTVDPYGLAHKGGAWYLVADHRRRPRMFRVSRVVAAKMLATPVRRRPGVEFTDLWEPLRRQVERLSADVPVRVRVRRRILDVFERIMGNVMAGPPAAGTDDAAEWTEVELRLRSIGEGRRLIGFGDDVEVLSPAAIRGDLARVAASVVELYGADGVEPPPPTR